MKPRWTAWAAALAALLLGSPLSAQVLGGKVMDRTSSEPIPEAVVEVLNANGRSIQRSRTDKDGFFVFELREPGQYRLRTARVGYQTVTSDAVEVESRQTVQVEIRIATGEVTLDPLTVTARTAPPRSQWLEREGFYDREKTGFGVFLTQYELSQRMAVRPTDFFRGIAGVQVSTNGMRNRVIMTRSGSNCAPRVLLDGGPVADSDLDSFVQQQDVAAIEIYRGPSEIAGRWMGQSSSCGLIVIWTKRGEPNR
ncbi:MAG: carboxypeptidase regulatory-like domain-containing protein [Longimicrobiaceae bacterium]